MIAANELRIGNWVEYNINFPPTEFIQVREINKADDFSDCNPIPLTPEIARKAGIKFYAAHEIGIPFFVRGRITFRYDKNECDWWCRRLGFTL